MHDMTDAKSMGVARVRCARKDVETESELPDPAQALVIECFQDASFHPIQRDVTVNIIEDDFLEGS